VGGNAFSCPLDYLRLKDVGQSQSLSSCSHFTTAWVDCQPTRSQFVRECRPNDDPRRPFGIPPIRTGQPTVGSRRRT